jgi:hypothetical protein
MRFFAHSNKATRDFRELGESAEKGLRASRDYYNYLVAISNGLPKDTRSFALADWYRDPRHHDCPHDAWLLSVFFKAGAGGDRSVNLELTVLGAYHDRVLQFYYSNVVEAKFDIVGETNENVGDWLADEFGIIDQHRVSHEILWQKGSQWRIVADQVKLIVSDFKKQ